MNRQKTGDGVVCSCLTLMPIEEVILCLQRAKRHRRIGGAAVIWELTERRTSVRFPLIKNPNYVEFKGTPVCKI